MKYSKPGRCFRCVMLSIEPVDRLSRTRTSWPLSSSASERCDPMKPAPPVMSARTREFSPRRDVRLIGGREVSYDGCNEFDVAIGHAGVQRQRQDFATHLVGDGACSRIDMRQRRLTGHR